jgi:hypothetical protein
VLLAARIHPEVITAMKELDHGFSGTFAIPPKYRMAMDVRILYDHIVSHSDKSAVELKFSQDMLFCVVRVKDDHCRPTLHAHANLLHDLRICGTPDQACDPGVPD